MPAHGSHDDTTPYCPRPISSICLGMPHLTKSHSEVLSSARRAKHGACVLRIAIRCSSVCSNWPDNWFSNERIADWNASWDWVTCSWNCNKNNQNNRLNLKTLLNSSNLKRDILCQLRCTQRIDHIRDDLQLPVEIALFVRRRRPRQWEGRDERT